MSDETEGEKATGKWFSRPAPSPDRAIEDGAGAHDALGEDGQRVGHDHACTVCGAPHGPAGIAGQSVWLDGKGTPDEPWSIDLAAGRVATEQAAHDGRTSRATRVLAAIERARFELDEAEAGRGEIRERVTLTGKGVPDDPWVMDGVTQLPGETYGELVCRTQYPDPRHDALLLALVAVVTALGAALLVFGWDWPAWQRGAVSLTMALVVAAICRRRLERVERR